MAKTTTIIVKQNGKPAKGAIMTVGHPFNKRFTLGADGKVSANLADGFVTVTNIRIVTEHSQMGISGFEIVAGETYEIEV